ncbi:transcriptional repressor [Nocardioides mangrovicus]|uniref:Transcriptional repressor n=1 Tax=Nocardioides mangrovicus TaxID=2478913 RepID=A0A3L8NZE9_9ACTN|nr:Fur family transcriptional regulator [Nocardioides mangrovicus]RLV47669.1 transcriptional repressor [Nocardioides mangrovicus]
MSETAEQDWQERLRSSGHRLTAQRELVLAAVETLGHATPEEVHAEVRRHSSAVNLSTVYRTLDLLDELGLIHHAHIEDRTPTYHSTRGHEHFHLVCHQCREVISLGADQAAPFVLQAAADHGFAVDVGHLTVFGTCASCQEAPGQECPDAEGGSSTS